MMKRTFYGFTFYGAPTKMCTKEYFGGVNKQKKRQAANGLVFPGLGGLFDSFTLHQPSC